MHCCDELVAARVRKVLDERVGQFPGDTDAGFEPGSVNQEEAVDVGLRRLRLRSSASGSRSSAHFEPVPRLPRGWDRYAGLWSSP